MVLSLHDITRYYTLSLSFANCRFLWKRKQAQQYKSTWRRSSPFQLILQYAELRLSIKKHNISLIFLQYVKLSPKTTRSTKNDKNPACRKRTWHSHCRHSWSLILLAMSVYSKFLLSYVFCWFIDSLSHYSLFLWENFVHH